MLSGGGGVLSQVPPVLAKRGSRVQNIQRSFCACAGNYDRPLTIGAPDLRLLAERRHGRLRRPGTRMRAACQASESARALASEGRRSTDLARAARRLLQD